MQVFLEAIKFNHNPDSADKDALNIRKNETEFVTVPEWRRGISIKPEDSPAAYAICETRGNQITIQAKLSCTDPSLESIEVRAIDGIINPLSPPNSLFGKIAIWLVRPLLRASIGSLLGEVKPRRVYFCEGQSKFETFELKNMRLWDEGARLNDIVWRWQFRLSPSRPWTDLAMTTHRIYALLKVPTLPWKQNPYLSSNTQLPWREVLDYACDWASSTKLTDDAATCIARTVYDLGPTILRYESGDHYITHIWGNFDGTAFLAHLRGAIGLGPKVNCTDCATIVSTLANILGCDLSQSTMSDFTYNPIKKIGESVWSPGFFEFHEVAWEGECGKDNDVFDACLKVDGDEDPTSSPHTPLQPTNLRFGSPSDRQYHYRLVAPSNPNAAQPKPIEKTRRAVGKDRKIREQRLVDKELLRRLRRVYNAESWRDLNLLGENLFLRDFILRDHIFMGWRLNRIEIAETSHLPSALSSIWQSNDRESRALLRIDLFECASLRVAHDFLMELLTQFQTRDMDRREYEGIYGDVVFATSDETRIAFVRANIVLMLRNLQADFPLTDVARQADQSIISQPKVGYGQEMRGFQISRFDPYDRDVLSRRIDLLDPFKGLPFTYKFFSKTGEVSDVEGDLIYRPSAAGEQTILVIALRADGFAFSQELHFNAG